jgi:hypothetical protein
MGKLGRSLRSGVFAATAVAVTLLVPNLAMAGTLDQQQPIVGTTGWNAHSTQSVAQTFTAGVSGKLDQVDLNLSESESPDTPTYPLIVELRDFSGDLPGGTILASQIVPASDVVPFSNSSWVSVAFPTPGSVTAGTHYAIVARSDNVYPETYSWREGGTDPYAAGAAYWASPPTAPWTPVPGPTDFAFKTYVVPPQAQTSTGTTPPTGQRAAALKKCKKKNKKNHNAKQFKKCKKKANRLPI